MAAGITGTLAAGALFDLYGLQPICAALVVLFAFALAASGFSSGTTVTGPASPSSSWHSTSAF
jgi:hypothetical protein